MRAVLLTSPPPLSRMLHSPNPPTQCTHRYGPCEPASLQERMVRAVAALGEEEVRSIIEEVGFIEVGCELCNEKYQFPEEQVMAMVEEMKTKA